ncbi:MAG: rhodanese-like domain-containing protein [Thiohalomonadales bacterium]
MSRTLNAEELKSLLPSDSIQLIDVRRKEDKEDSTDSILDATWYDPTQIAYWKNSLDKDKEVILFCVRGGGVSNSVLDTLQESNLKARYLEGGIEAWKGIEIKNNN